MKNAKSRLEKYLVKAKHWQNSLAERGLTETEASCLVYLGTRNIVGQQNAVPIRDLFEELVPPHSTSRISSATVNFYKKGLLIKQINPIEQRSTLVSLTPKGLAEYKKLEELFDEHQRGVQ